MCHGYALGAITADERVSACTSAIESGELLDYGKARAFDSRARLHRGKKEFEWAVADFSSAIALKPNSDDCYYQRAITNREFGRRDVANADYTRVVELDEGDFLARAALEELGVNPPPRSPAGSDNEQSGRACYFGW